MSHQSFDVEARWPELFDQLDTNQRRAVVRSLAAGWHEGWEANRQDVADLIDYTRGALTFNTAKRSGKTAGSKSAGRTKMGYYAPPEDSERIRAAFIAARNAGRPWRSFSDFQLEAILEKVTQLEAELNGGRMFEGAPAHTLSPGRPLE